ncbi:MAG: sugar ABC transporter permease [Syntrophomonadaceae bacterium]|nr:sugar ABC transporter permease [Syntrophomonadaceae bacterium]
MASSLLFALCLQKKFFGSRLSKSVLLFPMILPAASMVMVIDVFFSKAGITNELLVKLGFPVIDWLHSSAAFWILIALYLWKNIGFCTLIMLVGLNEIENDLYEAAKMDGADALARFRFITLPLLKPTMLFVSVLSIINCFKVYREAFLLGGPHPDESIYMLQHFLNNNLQNFNYQRLSVAAIVLFVFILTIMCMMLIFRSRKEE